MALKRVHYFDHQFLKVHDFQAEQDYHLDMRRRHNRSQHGWGVVEGLEVRQKGQRDITIDPGMALDNLGREIVISSQVTCQLVSLERNTHVSIVLGYEDEWDEQDHYTSGGIEDYTRVTETCKIEERKEPPRDGSFITVARVHLNENGHILRVENNVRTLVASRGHAAGWVRLPFKPVRLEPLRIGEKLVPPKQWDPGVEFTVDVVSSYCEKSARGSMNIPVPPGASKIKAFRMCGTTRGKVEVELVRGGWNPEGTRGEHKVLMKRTVEREGFDEHVTLEEDLQPLNDFHALAVSVIAEGKTEIWLVAAHFE